MTDLTSLISSLQHTTFDPEGPQIQDLTTRLARTSITSTPSPRSSRAAHYYALNISHIPSTLKPLTLAELAEPNVQAVLQLYKDWLVAEDTDLLDEKLPDHPWILSIISKAMVSVMVARAEKGDGRMPAQSPVGHPYCPFWVEGGKRDGNVTVGQTWDGGEGGSSEGDGGETYGDGDVEMA